MSTLTLLLIRLAFLAVLWLFVIAAVGVVRTDLLGSSRPGRQRRQRKPPQAKAQRPPRPGRIGREVMPARPSLSSGRRRAYSSDWARRETRKWWPRIWRQ